MSLNIKDPQVHRLARELADLTGETMSAAVTQAIDERLERVRGERGMRLRDRLLMIGQDCAAHLMEPYRSINHDELLYDERGVPA